MGGRRDDSAPDRAPVPPVTVASRSHQGWLVLGLVLATGATAAVLATDDARYLRVAVLAVCWAFVVAAFLAGNGRGDQVAAAAREAELRHTYDIELEREVTARHRYESGLESRLRQEAEDAMRAELAQLRTELAGLSRLRDDLAGLGQLRTEMAALTEIRGELAGLSRLRTELAPLAELRGDLVRMRSELTEQLSGELLIERMVMRAQSVRGPAQPVAAAAEGSAPEGSRSWDLDTPAETRVVPDEPVAPRSVPVPPTPARVLSPVQAVQDAPADRKQPAQLRHRRAAEPDAGLRAESGHSTGSRYDDILFGTSPRDPWLGSTSHLPASSGTPSWSGGGTADDPSGHHGAPDEPVAEQRPEPPGHARLEQILAESGVAPPSGGRSRRRRYRDEDGATGDDVLARVLGRD